MLNSLSVCFCSTLTSENRFAELATSRSHCFKPGFSGVSKWARSLPPAPSLSPVHSSGGNDIHRLVRMTAPGRLILRDRRLDCSTPTTRARHRRDGPGLEIGPQLAPDPERPIQSADRSPAMWVAAMQTRERSSQKRMKPRTVLRNRDKGTSL